MLQSAYNEIRTLRPGFPFEKVKATLAVRCLQNIFFLSWFSLGASVLKDVGGSSSKVKGRELKLQRQREMEKQEPREAWGVGGQGKVWWLHTSYVPGTKPGAPTVICSQLKCGETHVQRGWGVRPWSHRDQNQLLSF